MVFFAVAIYFINSAAYHIDATKTSTVNGSRSTRQGVPGNDKHTATTALLLLLLLPLLLLLLLLLPLLLLAAAATRTQHDCNGMFS